MERNWRDVEEMERDLLSTFPHFLFISSLYIHFLYQNQVNNASNTKNANNTSNTHNTCTNNKSKTYNTNNASDTFKASTSGIRF